MKLKLWQVDAFASRPFEGNPAAIVPLETWLPDETLQAIAEENNLAETAFFVATDEGRYHLRWFTPTMEVPLCGHATLASAWVLFFELDAHGDRIRFNTLSGTLEVSKDGDQLSMALPAGTVELFDAPKGYATRIGDALGIEPPCELHCAPHGAGGVLGLMAVFSESALRQAKFSQDLHRILNTAGFNALIATAKAGTPHDFVSRFFAPGMGVPEDPVTGSAHATLAPFWAARLNKKALRAFQASPRGGDILCTHEKARVALSGNCVLYMRGEIVV